MQPTRRIATTIVASGVLVAGVTGIATARSVSPAATAHHARTLHLTQEFGDWFSLDLGDTGPSGGDEFGGPVTWYSGSRAVAHVGGICTTTSLQPPQDQCILSARFADGVLTAQTLFDEQSNAPADYAITGGSKAYRDATGYLTVENDATQVTIHLDTDR
jgi:hypothetical protein